MQFSRLRLTGFKSFVDPTDLTIADGLTGVVGPNGCGKSNLLEALRWVMGENRPTAMRGDGMEDVIFAGVASRPARNFAEVVLHLDNSDRLAPAAFNDADQLEIVRRVTRDVGSAYKVNATDVRARDVQMLFADASTGAHSPALVRQGQISELINAKPKARRRVLEEAAGISGLYQRRHEAELKLRAAETNLARVDDVIDQLAGQLAQLARQAKQAARYRRIGEDLRRAEGLLLYRRWNDAEAAHAAAGEDLRARTLDVARAEAAARDAVALRARADESLPGAREEEAIAAAILQRLEVERDTLAEQETAARDRIATLEGRIAQLARDIDRETGLNRDAGETVTRLEAEAADLAAAGQGHEDRLTAAQSEAAEAARILEDREAELGQATEDMARLSARHQSAQRLIDDSRKTLSRSEAEAERARATETQAQAALEKARTDHAAATEAETRAVAEAERAEAALDAATAALSDAQAQEADARAARSAAEGETGALRAEVTALKRLVARDSAEGGQILDHVRVAPGFETALGAALADDLRAPEVAADGPSGWAVLPDYTEPQPLPDGAVPLGDHVTVPGVLARRIAQVGLVDADDAPRLHAQLKPGQRLVTRGGDLWRWDGFRTRAEDAPSAAALRLQQLNRLQDLTAQLDAAEARAAAAVRVHDGARATLDRCSAEDRAAREARRDADAAVNAANRALSRAEADRNLAQSRLDQLGLAVSRHEDEARAAGTALADAERALADLGDLDAMRTALDDIKVTVEAARMTMMTKRANADELRHEGERRNRRAAEIAREIAGWQRRLQTAETRGAELCARRTEAEAELAEASAVPGALAAKRTDLGAEITSADARRAAAADALSSAEGTARQAALDERDAERRAGEAREARARAEARVEAVRETRDQAAGRIAEALDLTPEALRESLEVDPGSLPEVETLEADVGRLRRQRDALGAVNLRAEEDAREVEAEHDTLTTEKADLEDAIKTLRGGIASLNREGRARLLSAFDQVNDNFAMLFRHLFGGGEAKLALVESDDPLEAGLEIMCQPPGKKLSTLSLLSGGEQTLTALALIFAVFLANPAPICVLDEVDAPLDDANVTRFCDMLDEMGRRTDTRFLIITHHAVTMSRMDRLFGVTMAEQGVSQLVSVDLRKAEQMVA